MARLRIFATRKRIRIKKQDNRNRNIASGIPFARNFFKISCTLFYKKGKRIRQIDKNRKIRRLDKHLNREEVQLCLNSRLILRGVKKRV